MGASKWGLQDKVCVAAGDILLRASGSLEDTLAKSGRAIKTCGLPFGTQVVVAQTSENKVKLQMRWCHRRCCPRCQVWSGLALRDRVAETCRLWESMDPSNGFLFATFTLAHKKSVFIGSSKARDNARKYLKECDALLKATWRAFSQTYKAEIAAEIGWISQLRRNEVTVGCGRPVSLTDAGIDQASRVPRLSYHHHIHAIVFTSGKKHRLTRHENESIESYSDRQGAQNLALSQKLYAAWSRALESVLNKDPERYPFVMSLKAEERPVVFKPELGEKVKTFHGEDGSARAVRFAVVKGGTTLETTYGDTAELAARYIAAEVTKPFTKSTQTASSFSFKEALEHFGTSAQWLNVTFAHWAKNSASSSEYEWGRLKLGTKFVGFEAYCRGGEKRESDLPETKTVALVSRERFLNLKRTGELESLFEEANKNAEPAEYIVNKLGPGLPLQHRIHELEGQLKKVRLAVALIKRPPRPNGRRTYDHRSVLGIVPAELRREMLRQLTDDGELEIRKYQLKMHPYEILATELNELKDQIGKDKLEIRQLQKGLTDFEVVKIKKEIEISKEELRKKIARKICRILIGRPTNQWVSQALKIAVLELVKAEHRRLIRARKLSRAVAKGLTGSKDIPEYLANLLREVEILRRILMEKKKEMEGLRPPTRLRLAIEFHESLANDRELLIREYAENWLINNEAVVAPTKEEWRQHERERMAFRAWLGKGEGGTDYEDTGEI